MNVLKGNVDATKADTEVTATRTQSRKRNSKRPTIIIAGCAVGILPTATLVSHVVFLKKGQKRQATPQKPMNREMKDFTFSKY